MMSSLQTSVEARIASKHGKEVTQSKEKFVQGFILRLG